MQYPKMMRIQQHFNAPEISDIPSVIRNELSKMDLSQRIKPDETVAISVGSRGIANIALITKSLVAELKKYWCEAFHCPGDGESWRGNGRGAAIDYRRLWRDGRIHQSPH